MLTKSTYGLTSNLRYNILSFYLKPQRNERCIVSDESNTKRHFCEGVFSERKDFKYVPKKANCTSTLHLRLNF